LIFSFFLSSLFLLLFLFHSFLSSLHVSSILFHLFSRFCPAGVFSASFLSPVSLAFQKAELQKTEWQMAERQ